ncbi:DUF2853 family protein [Gaetbulibacter aestuarii]|uniref:DUF2853 family protein n=1 Tax=Gaetbulibacter aestuarii TaxID=1502358 RepID=A0ABW7N3H2_9FLAO
MNQREALIEKYAAELKEKFNTQPDMALLTKVTIGLGPSIYKPDAATVSSSDPSELERVKTNFLIGKLGLPDTPDLDEAIVEVVEHYGQSNRVKYRAVIYYLLTRHFGKESIYLS